VTHLVVKLGGHTLDDLSPTSTVLADLACDVAEVQATGVTVSIVHGGGPQIAALLGARGIASTFVDGLRVTDDETMECVAMALGFVNQSICAALTHNGLRVAGVSGVDGGLLIATALGETWGRAAGSPRVEPSVVTALAANGFAPVVSPVAVDEKGYLVNCNADTAAGALAGALAAELVLLSDVDQLRSDPADASTGLATVSAQQIDELVATGAIRDGMRPKVQAALDALTGGAPQVRLANGTRPHALRALRAGTLATTAVVK
jgi:acetylglutamate kinase